MKDSANALPIYIGYDPREVKAYDVAKASLVKNSSKPVVVQALKLHQLRKIGVMTRPVEMKDGRMWCPISQAPMATEFAISRFCTPFVHPNTRMPWALFVDCDVLFLSDAAELFALADSKYAVMVVKHKQESGPETKMDNQLQTFYARKNWSSVMLWNTTHESHLRLAGIEGPKPHTDEHGRFTGFDWASAPLNTWPGRDLHAFKWLKDEEIGELPAKWNWLVNVTPGEPKEEGLWHYTLGGPWIKGWKSAPRDDRWLQVSGVLT